jgi:hypothetical protein
MTLPAEASAANSDLFTLAPRPGDGGERRGEREEI